MLTRYIYHYKSAITTEVALPRVGPVNSRIIQPRSVLGSSPTGRPSLPQLGDLSGQLAALTMDSSIRGGASNIGYLPVIDRRISTRGSQLQANVTFSASSPPDLVLLLRPDTRIASPQKKSNSAPGESLAQYSSRRFRTSATGVGHSMQSGPRGRILDGGSLSGPLQQANSLTLPAFSKPL